ncbi:helix-turn-helix domain-containing protein [Pyramidobacter piscolens]|uniref:helix-turn-helix domain-containing protein n=1 Tax=Pyramidobacter piscolens TaxID=638849 RepID=UPI002AB242F7|nr:helix-turn-helix domain-containing protein [Pyramidobacter piscolens]
MSDNAFSGERLKKLRDERNMSRQEMADLIGIKNQNTIYRWEINLRKPSRINVQRLAKALQVSSSYLMGENVPLDEKNEVQAIKDQILVPVYKNIEPHCGPGNNNEGVVGEIETYLPLSAAGLGTSDVDKVFGVRVDGSSMEAADISDGSIAIIRRCNGDWVPPYGAPCYVQYMKNGFMLDAIKFYYPSRDGRSARIASAEGSGVAPIYFDEKELEAEYLRVIGVVVSVVESHKPRYGR